VTFVFTNKIRQFYLTFVLSQSLSCPTLPLSLRRVVGANFSFETKYILKIPDSSHYKKYSGSCFMSLSDIINHSQTISSM